MIIFEAKKFLYYMDIMREFHKAAEEKGDDLDDKHQLAFEKMADEVEEFFYGYEIDLTYYCNRIRSKLLRNKLGRPGLKTSLATMMSELRTRVYEVLGGRKFMFIPTAQAEYLHHAAIFGYEVTKQFPTANMEIVEAGNCYATGNNTACVFHLMRAVEYGVRTVFKRLRIKFPINPKRPNDKRPIEERQWGEIHGAIDEEIKRLEKKKATRIRDEKIEFLRGVNNQFKYFKNKWRNNVMHSKESYEVKDAKKTMRQVGDFLEHLAGYVKE